MVHAASKRRALMTGIDGSGKQHGQSTRMNPTSAPWIEELHSNPAPRHRPNQIMDTHRRRRRRLRFAPLFLRRRIVALLLLCRCSLAPLLLRKRLLAPCRLRRRRLEREGREQPGRTAGRAKRISILPSGSRARRGVLIFLSSM